MNKETDRELLELAAKAMGYTTEHKWNAERLELNPPVTALVVYRNGELVSTGWNPLEDYGYALQLSAILQINIRYSRSFPTCDSGASVYASVQVKPNKPAFEVNRSFVKTLYRLRLLENESRFAEYMCRPEREEERWLPNEVAAVCRVIVRAAAEVGRNIK